MSVCLVNFAVKVVVAQEYCCCFLCVSLQ